MTRHGKKTLALGMAAALLLSPFTDSVPAAASAKKVKLNKGKLTMVKGGTTTLILKNYTGTKKVKWSVNKKKIVKLTPKGKRKVKLTARKKGKVTVTAKVGKKKYLCKITVKTKASTGKVTDTAQPTTGASIIPETVIVPMTSQPEETTVESTAPETTLPTPEAWVATEAAVTTSSAVTGGAVDTPMPTVDVSQHNQSHALIKEVTSDSKEVQGVSVYSKSQVNLVEVFGSFTDIQEVYQSLSFEFASKDGKIVDSRYSGEAYFSDTTPGYYTLEVEGTLEGEKTTQTYFVGRAGIFTYKQESDGGLVIKNYEGWGEHLVVPTRLDGMEVTACGKESFYHKQLSDVVLQKGMTQIRNKAFYNAQMRYVEMPDTLKEIGTEAFLNCSVLSQVDLPGGLDTLGVRAFYKTPWLAGLEPDENGLVISGNVLLDGYSATGDVEIPKGIICIAREAFKKNPAMTKVTIPDTVTKLSYQSFSNCASLAAVSVPATLQQFEGNVFYHTPWLKQQEEESEDDIVVLNGVLIQGQNASDRITISPEVIAIAPYAFDGADISSILGMENVREIGEYAFADSSLTSISLPKGLETIKPYTFQDASDLISVVMPETVTTISRSAFSGCASLDSVQLSVQTTVIEENAFNGCMGLTSITLPASLETVGSTAFYRCDSLEKVIVNGSTTNIAQDAFYRCYNEKLTFYVTQESAPLDWVKAKGYSYSIMPG